MAIKSPDRPRTILQETYRRFWEGFNLYTKCNLAFCKEFKVHPYPSVRSYQDYHIGEPFHIVVGINFKNDEIRIGAYFSNLNSYRFWSEHGKQWLESYLNRHLSWKQFKTKGSIHTFKFINLTEKQRWEKAYSTMADTMIQLKKALMQDIKL